LSLDVVGIGNALTDAVVRIADDALLAECGLTRGQMSMADDAAWRAVYARVHSRDVTLAAGGSCANVISTLGLLGDQVCFRGRVGDDTFGDAYAQSLIDACGRHALDRAPGAVSGKCLALVSHVDAERTMLTDLGAAGALGSLGEMEAMIATARAMHFEGYVFLGGPIRETAFAALAAAEAAGVPISFDASDPFVARTITKDVEAVIKDHAHICFLNREEAEALTGKGAHAAIDELRRWTDIAVVKLGGEGSLVAADGEVVHVPAVRVDVVDTTGAGDSYAGGFLHGWLAGWAPRHCGTLGSRVASMAVAQLGAVVRDRQRLSAARSAVAAEAERG
jgi:sugar/nucleoside kinase (ribokinase family)